MNKQECRLAPICSAIVVVTTTAVMSAFIDWAYSDVAIPEEGIVAAIDASLVEFNHDPNLVCVRPASMAHAERLNP